MLAINTSAETTVADIVVVVLYAQVQVSSCSLCCQCWSNTIKFYLVNIQYVGEQMVNPDSTGVKVSSFIQFEPVTI